MEVARELATGARTKQIARTLNLSEGTVKLHLSAIFRVLGCNSRAKATAILARHLPDA
jgi:DNA-binding NarL/FixJ family response regulator